MKVVIRYVWWGAPEEIEPATGATSGGPANDYYAKTGNLGCFAWGGYIYQVGTDRRELRVSTYWRTFMLVAKADAENAQIIAERQWPLNTPGSTTWSHYSHETGNADCDAPKSSGSHYLDIASNFGMAMIWQLEAVDVLSPVYVELDGKPIYSEWCGKAISGMTLIDGVAVDR